MLKTCFKCKTEKQLEQFHKDKTKKDGLMGKCKVCMKEYQKKFYKENKDIINKRNKKYREENKEKISEQVKKYRNEHKEKMSEINKKYYEENKEEIREYYKKYYEENKEEIKEMNRQYYEKNKEKISEYYEENKEKIRENNKKYYEENKEKINKRAKKYREEHREKISEQNKKYREEHREKLNEYYRNRKKTDEGYRISCNLRCRLNIALKGATKSAPTMELLGVPSIEFLRDYLEGTKVEGKDYSDAHIDHIRPCASFDMTDPAQQRECFHYTNLQLLPALENISKGDKIVFE